MTDKELYDLKIIYEKLAQTIEIAETKYNRTALANIGWEAESDRLYKKLKRVTKDKNKHIATQNKLIKWLKNELSRYVSIYEIDIMLTEICKEK